MNGILAQVASNLKTSCEVTDAAFSKRTGEVKHAKGKLEEQKSETIVKIQELENTLQSLEQAIMAKQGPLATCQAKIHQVLQLCKKITRSFTIMEKAPTWAFSRLKASTY